MDSRLRRVLVEFILPLFVPGPIRSIKCVAKSLRASGCSWSGFVGFLARNGAGPNEKMATADGREVCTDDSADYGAGAPGGGCWPQSGEFAAVPRAFKYLETGVGLSTDPMHRGAA